MAGYAASNLLGGTQQSMTTTFKTALVLAASNGTSLQRFMVHDIIFGTDGTPADQAMTWDVSRTTASGTATSITPNKIDLADGAFLGVGLANNTVEPTVTSNSNLLPIGANQRASMRWVAFPGQELVVPATDAAGLAFRAKSPGYTGTVIVNAHFRGA
ncbi:hypothetical protein [Rhodobium gokarnense]|uniref:Uncharacterized protein n=1 Tax=Rhodobium gokarnense TaxID=364296 RepID=A0ABT3HH63_9HYPH|nr:hypothetical protein [Rhodobium gokarnense]MCW2309745.1 hypothetical protein [Rhodobium gokarnense]